MRSDKKKAIALRKQGKSYNEIHAALGIPKSTLSLWLRSLHLSQKARHRLKKRRTKGIVHLIKMNKAQSPQAQERAQIIRNDAAKSVQCMVKDPLFCLGIGLYWGEGYKGNFTQETWRCVDFTNSDPYMIATMMKFFREVCCVKEEKFRMQLHLHDNENEKEHISFWENITGVPSSQFVKTQWSPTKKNKRRLHHGTIHIRIYSVDLLNTMRGWITGMAQTYNKTECSSVG